MKKIIVVSFLIMISCRVFAEQNTPFTKVPAATKQIIFVIAASKNANRAMLQRYARTSNSGNWQKIGIAIPVVIGRNGMTANKKEGDGKSPAGIFKVGPAFGFAVQPPDFIQLKYQSLGPTTECVDDERSQFYNQIINSDQVKKDWHSSELMRAVVPQYELGLVVAYNSPQPIKGNGSCIFIHIWQSSTIGTSGCTAMSKENLATILAWLNPRDQPRLIQVIQS